jgi:hypothetical protein
VQADAVDHDVALLEGLQRVDGLDQRGLARADGPQTTTTSPLLMLVEQSVSTCTGPYHLETFLISIMFSPTSANDGDLGLQRDAPGQLKQITK